MTDIPGDITSTQTGETAISGPIAVFSGELEFAGDHDWFRLELTQTLTISFFLHLQVSGSPGGDSFLTIRDANGGQIVFNDDGIPGGANSALTRTFDPGIYFIDVGAFSETVIGQYSIVATQFDHAMIDAGQTPFADTITAAVAGRFFGGPGDDIITLSALGNEAYGEQGNDTLVGNSLSNRLIGGLGNDTLSGDGGSDILSGDAGDDLLLGGSDNDELLGGDGLDVLFGEAGNDILRGGAGGDRMTGGDDSDSYFVDSIFDRVIETNADQGTGGFDSVYSNISFVLPDNVENLILMAGFGNFNGTGNASANIIVGNEGNNILDGGIDSVSDSLEGNAGNDTYILRNGNDTVIETSGIDTISSTITRSLLSYTGIENLSLLGSSIANGTGSNAANKIIGNSAANMLKGNNGNDTLIGNSGNDKLFGDIGNDSLNGGAGLDRLTGGSGRDTLTGGASRDVFDYNALAESRGSLRDRITDFQRKVDDIDLSTIDANTKLGGNQRFKFIGDDSFNKVAGELHAVRIGSLIRVEGDVNGDGKADFAIDVLGTAALVSGDFIL